MAGIGYKYKTFGKKQVFLICKLPQTEIEVLQDQLRRPIPTKPPLRANLKT